jgi:D-serine deaminase-like pyridoxal phosphate-dependent protein
MNTTLSTPALVVDIKVLRRNLIEMRDVADRAGVELFPHAKTHRMPEVGLLQIEHGANGLCVAKLGEAERLVAAGIKRIIVPYPLVGEDKAHRALALHSIVDLIIATDSVDGAREIGAVFAEAGERARILLLVDSGLGREGVSFDAAPPIADKISKIAGVDLVGIYTHEGSVYGATDRADLERRSFAAGTAMVATAQKIRDFGIALPIVSMGASASARAVTLVPGVTQICPGIYAFNDVGQIALGNATLETTALRVIATVVSHPESGRACIDAGSKALSTDLVTASGHRDEYPGYGLIVDKPGWQIEKMSEEHGWLRWHGEGEPSALPVGTRIEIVPNHACMVFAMLRKASVVSDGEVIETWEGMGSGSSE